MRKASVSSACAIIFWLFGHAPQLAAQQITVTTPQRPAASPWHVRPRRAREPEPQPEAAPSPTPPAEPRPEELPPQGAQRADQPPPYYDYPFGSKTTSDRMLTVDEAVALALAQAPAYQLSQLDERIAAEDLKQARAAFFPQFSMPLTYVGTTPSQVRSDGDPITFSLLSANSINQMLALFNAAGEVDLSGRLRASLRRSRYLLEGARAGSLVARRGLVLATVDAYYGLVLARQKRRLADETLSLAEGFVRVAEGLAARGEGEVGDLIRARIEAIKRRDELEQARAGESAALDMLRVLTGVDFATHISVTRITEDVPESLGDLGGPPEELIKARPELGQLDALRRAALADVRVARGERMPQFTYSLNGGFDTADLNQIKRFSGGQALFSINVPIFNFGASKSRETQARLRAQALDLQRESTQRQLRQEFYTARAAALSALVRIRETEAGAQAAQKNVTLVLARYRMKKATITEVVDAQSAYGDARLAYYQALTDYRTARIRLEPVPGQ